MRAFNSGIRFILIAYGWLNNNIADLWPDHMTYNLRATISGRLPIDRQGSQVRGQMFDFSGV